MVRFVGLLLAVASAVWVNVDARRLGVRRGRLGGGGLDLSVTSWVLATLVIWIVGFPGYLVARGRYQALQSPAGGFGPAPGHGYYSPDGRWWWDGLRWVPATPPSGQPAPGPPTS